MTGNFLLFDDEALGQSEQITEVGPLLAVGAAAGLHRIFRYTTQNGWQRLAGFNGNLPEEKQCVWMSMDPGPYLSAEDKGDKWETALTSISPEGAQRCADGIDRIFRFDVNSQRYEGLSGFDPSKPEGEQAAWQPEEVNDGAVT